MLLCLLMVIMKVNGIGGTSEEVESCESTQVPYSDKAEDNSIQGTLNISLNYFF